jgi:predicted DNA-binding WGR domain protein
MLAMVQILQKIDHTRRQSRFYAISVARTLFGETCVISEWGRIGAGGKLRHSYFADAAAAERFANSLRARKERRGYAVLPEQVPLL